MSEFDHVDALLRDKPQTRIGKDGLADNLHLSRFQLYRRVKAETGTSPKKLAGKYRLDHACKLLAETSLSVKAIAAEVGVPDANYFTRFFKLRTGLSPRLWRKRHGGKPHVSAPLSSRTQALRRMEAAAAAATAHGADMPVHLL